MKKMLLIALMFVMACAPAYAIDSYKNAAAPGAATVTNADETKAVLCGVAGDYDFYMKGTWVLFKGLLAGTIYPIQCTGVRDGDDTDVEAGDLLYLR